MSRVVARLGEIAPGETKKFVLDCGGREVSGFVANVGGALHAWVNRCRHVAMEMDWVENRFFTEDGRFLQCATHGALYVPDTGECVAGPPCGKSLYRVPLRIVGGEVWADCPDRLPDG